LDTFFQKILSQSQYWLHLKKMVTGHLKFKFQQLLKNVFYWPPKLQLYGPPYTGQPINTCPRQIPFLSTLKISWNETNIIFRKFLVQVVSKMYSCSQYWDWDMIFWYILHICLADNATAGSLGRRRAGQLRFGFVAVSAGHIVYMLEGLVQFRPLCNCLGNCAIP
jgi:hypothetical protein